MSSTGKFNVLIVGAGRINFGSTEASWNHSARIEKKLGSRLNVVGLIDVAREHAENIIKGKRADDSVKAGWANTRVFASVEEASNALGEHERPQLVVNGLPPNFRGSTTPGQDTDLLTAKFFPGCAQFIEKPISAASFEEVEKVRDALKQAGGVVSMGYMLRYLKAVDEMKKIIAENNLTVMATQATYLMAYKYAGETSKTLAYWDKDIDLGPIVSQGTHIVDLSRFFAPDAVLDSVHVHTVEAADKAGHLSMLKMDEEPKLPPERRIPRVTNAIWRYGNGATGSLIHGVCLHEGDYDCELVVLADGWKLRLVDPYGTAPRLYVRRPGTAVDTKTVFTDDDCYYNEFSNLIDVIDGKMDKSAIHSTYDDSVETYKFTWAIRLAGEKAASERGVLP